ncbi:malonate transporter [Salinisphaera orenii MK-B5]|uniref:Malonate transporter n=2 Tax=Salinisphaera orenii TaxID=856731 RepID=A0A423PYG4_9GAMM|nr:MULTISPECIES: malonate transporter subunit MadL [Salinisphaera]ROO23150.1 malonate transporter [Salinisphaera halophila YIM 95161]ROO30563.1 malonate transporter [Salinisphaera orenii MK-B5]
MVIYGVALLAACMLVGKLIGEVIGIAIGVDSNVGGVGLAMLLLVFVVYRMQKAGWLDTTSRRGVEFWSSLYIPIVVAMAAGQNVAGAIAGGPVALVGGLVVVAVSFALVPVIARLGKGKYAVPLDDLDTAREGRHE